MYYVSILKNPNGKLEIEYTEINPEFSKENQELAYCEAYKNQKEAIYRRDSLRFYGNSGPTKRKN